MIKFITTITKLPNKPGTIGKKIAKNLRPQWQPVAILLRRMKYGKI